MGSIEESRTAEGVLSGAGDDGRAQIAAHSYSDPYERPDRDLMLWESCFAKVVTTADGPSLLIGGHVIALRSTMSPFWADVIATGLRQQRAANTVKSD